jgi:hypothetical protein
MNKKDFKNKKSLQPKKLKNKQKKKLIYKKNSKNNKSFLIQLNIMKIDQI